MQPSPLSLITLLDPPSRSSFFFSSSSSSSFQRLSLTREVMVFALRSAARRNDANDALLILGKMKRASVEHRQTMYQAHAKAQVSQG